MKLIIAIIFMTIYSGHAQVIGGVSAESWQLQRLLEKSEQQLQTIREIAEFSKRDATTLDRATRVLEKLSEGIDQEIEQFKGTKVYDEALLRVQSNRIKTRKNDSAPTNSEFEIFQQKSLNANLSDITQQTKLEHALKTAPPGFIPKLQTQAELGGWQTGTRVSAQMTELLYAIHELREELRAKNNSGLAELVKGSEILNRKQREGLHAPR